MICFVKNRNIYLRSIFIVIAFLIVGNCIYGIADTESVIIGSLCTSDIVAYIDGQPIPSYNFDGQTILIVNDLNRYGFDVSSDKQNENYYIKYNKNKRILPIELKQEASPKSKKVGNINSTNVKTFVMNDEIQCYDVDGMLAIKARDLKDIAKVTYNGKKREVKIDLKLENLDENTYFDTIYYPNKELRYVGYLSNQVPNGEGKSYDKKGKLVYDGKWRNGQKYGFGSLKYEDGEEYKGYFLNDMKEGYGTYTYKDKGVYSGNWKTDKINGKGKYTFSNKEFYKGEWLNNKMNGYGIYQFSNGDKYEGNWRNNKMNGKGKYIFKRGYVFVGNWKENKFIKGEKVKITGGKK